jgi:cyanophycinase
MGAQGNGPLALVGGAEWTPPAAGLDAWLLERSASAVVTVVPTAAKDHPEMAVRTARRHFQALGAEVDAAMILTRVDAGDPSAQGRLASAAFVYLAGGDPGHLATVLAGTPAWAGIVDAWRGGAVLAGSSAGAMVLCDRMLRPGGRAPEAGLGLLEGTVVLPHHERWAARLPGVGATLGADPSLRLLGIDECTALVLEGEYCRVLGAGAVTRYSLAEGAPVPVWVRRAPAEFAGCLGRAEVSAGPPGGPPVGQGR